MNEEYKFYNTAEILDFLGIKYNFESEVNREYPFNRKPSDFIFDWGYLIIPREGIEKEIQNKISSKKEYISKLKEIKMLYHIPFFEKKRNSLGTIIVNVSLSFRYDKEYKYGDINKSLPEVCYAIEKMGSKTSNFYIIDSDNIHYFMSNYVINNQWGIGVTKVVSSPEVNLNDNFKEVSNE